MNQQKNLTLNVPLPMPSAPLFQVLRRAYGYLRPYWKKNRGGIHRPFRGVGVQYTYSAVHPLDHR